MNMERQIAELQNALTVLQENLNAILLTKLALEETKKMGGFEGLIPLGKGVYVRGKVEKSDKVLLDVGSGILVEKSIQEAIEFFEKERQKIIKEMEKIQVQLNIIAQKLRSMRERDVSKT